MDTLLEAVLPHLSLTKASIQLCIDDTPVNAIPGNSILSTSRDAGIFLPSLCMHPCLSPKHLCKICMVEIEGRGSLHNACLPVSVNMVIRTNTDRILEIRKKLLKDILLENHRDCLCCKQNMHCELQQVVGNIGVCLD